MNILRQSLPLLTLVAAASAQAAEHANTALDPVSITARTRLVLDCRAEHRPSMQAVANVLQTNNSAGIYAARERLMLVAHRECMRGAGYVAFVRDGGVQARALTLAGTSAQP
jgi:hypothetical protein